MWVHDVGVAGERTCGCAVNVHRNRHQHGMRVSTHINGGVLSHRTHKTCPCTIIKQHSARGARRMRVDTDATHTTAQGPHPNDNAEVPCQACAVVADAHPRLHNPWVLQHPHQRGREVPHTHRRCSAPAPAAAGLLVAAAARILLCVRCGRRGCVGAAVWRVWEGVRVGVPQQVRAQQQHTAMCSTQLQHRNPGRAGGYVEVRGQGIDGGAGA